MRELDEKATFYKIKTSNGFYTTVRRERGYGTEGREREKKKGEFEREEGGEACVYLVAFGCLEIFLFRILIVSAIFLLQTKDLGPIS